MTRMLMLASSTMTLPRGHREFFPFARLLRVIARLGLQRFCGKAKIDKDRESIKRHWSP